MTAAHIDAQNVAMFVLLMIGIICLICVRESRRDKNSEDFQKKIRPKIQNYGKFEL